MKRAAVLAAALLALSGCGMFRPPPESGYVLSKEYSAPYTYTVYDCIMRDPKTQACTVNMPRTVNEPAHWYLCLVDDNEKDYKGCREVDETTFHAYDPGMNYPDTR